MIGQIQGRSKSNALSTTPQSNKTLSKISLDYNSWLARFKIQPKVDSATERKDFVTDPSEKWLKIKRDSPTVQERPRPKSKQVAKGNPLNLSPKKTGARVELIKDNVSRVPSQFLQKVQAKLIKPPSPNKQEPLLDYTIGNTVGAGAYGVVKYGVHKVTNQKVAIKIYEKSKLSDITRMKSVQTEIKILSKLDHPNIIKLYKDIDTPNSLYIILEFVSGFSLSTSLKRKFNHRLEEYEANKYFRELLSALEYCHSQGIAHHDIKLENTLIDQTTNRIKLIDFGFASNISCGKKIKVFCGTPSYMSPEIMVHKGYYGPPVDIWAAGVLLYKLLTGTFPFKSPSDKELCKQIMRGHYIVPDYISLSAKQLLSKMLTVDPQKRPRACDLLKDPWFRSSSAFSICSTITHKSGGSFDQENTKLGKLAQSPKYKNLSNSFGSLDLQVLSIGTKVD
jgi:serine/threonine protein kinase